MADRFVSHSHWPANENSFTHRDRKEEQKKQKNPKNPRFLFDWTVRSCTRENEGEEQKLLCSSVNQLNLWLFSTSEKVYVNILRNVARTTTTVHYDWSLLNNRYIRDKYTLTLRNKYTSGDIRNTYSKWRIWELRQCPLRSGCRMLTN